MAQKVAAVTGAYSAAATWNSVTNTPTLHATTNITISTSNLFTATFTAPNTTNACTGVLLYIVAAGSGGTVTVTLQESTVDTAAAVSIAVTSLVVNTWVYFRFATPYVFAAAGAGAYRFKIVNAGAAGSTTAAADSGAANIAYMATDDRTGVPGTTDDVWICSLNQSTSVIVTVDGTQACGSGTYTGLITTGTPRQLGYAIHINNSSALRWDTAADATLTCKGSVTINAGGGEFAVGTVATPMPAARIGKFRFDWGAATNGQFGFLVNFGGKFLLQGASKTYYKTKYVSGAGTTASPLITADSVDWAVGDEILVAATSNNAANYNETETKFIRVKNSATSYTLADTSGGAESGLSFTHTTDAWILNVQRNVLIDSTDVAKGHGFYNKSVIAGDVNLDWARVETMGTVSTTNLWDLSSATATVPQIDYCVFYRSTGTRSPLALDSRSTLSFTGLIITGTGAVAVTSGDGALSFNGANNKTLTDCFFIKNSGNGLGLQSTFNVIFNTCAFISNNTGNNTGAGGIYVLSSGGIFNSCEINANRNRGINLSNSSDSIFNSNSIGNRGSNTIDIDNVTDAYNKALFDTCFFGSATLVSNYLNMALGSELSFHKANGTENNHFWYTATGINRNCGAGLVDTTTKTVGSFALRLAPENATVGLFWEFLIGLNDNSAASIFGFIQKNVAFGTDVVMVELFLPGSTTADASQTMGNTTGTWLVFSMAASYTGSVAAFARVRITAKTTTAAAYAYVSDLYNGTNVLTSFQAWNEGKPSPVFTDLLGDPASVWAILESTQTTVGTMGYEISTDLATLRADVDDLQTRLPAALTAGGNIKSDTLMIEGIDATNQIRDSVLTDATRFAGADVATILAAAIAIKTRTDNLPTDPADESNILAAIAALNNPATADIVTAIFAGIMEGLTFEEIIKDIWAQVVGDAVSNDATNPTQVEYDGPNGAVQVIHNRTATTRTKV